MKLDSVRNFVFALLILPVAAGAQVWERGNQLLLRDGPGHTLSQFGAALATGDFDGDDATDLVVGVPEDDGDVFAAAGRVQVFRGGASGLNPNSILDARGYQTSQYLGAAVVSGDFDGDGIDELAVGAPGADMVSNPVVDQVGWVQIYAVGMFGSLELVDNFAQFDPGVLGDAEEGDRFGSALAVGDFNGDGRDDLAIGVPSEDVGMVGNAGAVNVLYGGIDGLSATGNQLWYRAGGGISGEIHIGANLGAALAAGDFDGDGIDDLAIGIPRDFIDGTATADGSIQVLFGAVGAGLTSAGQQAIDRELIGRLPQGQSGSDFGLRLAAGDFNRSAACLHFGTCADDLAIGAPRAHDTANNFGATGAVYLLFGSQNFGGLDTDTDSMLDQDIYNPVLGTPPEDGDRFGDALAAGSLNDSARADLAIGSPEEYHEGVFRSGCAHVVRRIAPGFLESYNPDSQYFWAMPGLASAPVHTNMYFGAALAIGDFNGDGQGDLAIGITGYPLPGDGAAGAVQILLGALFADSFEVGSTGHWSSD